MSEYWKIILIALYFHKQILAADNAIDADDKIIDSSLQTNAQPCDDFYAYACGNYNQQNILNAALENKSLLDYANYHYNIAVINLLEAHGREEYQTKENCPALMAKVNNYFEACRKVNKKNLTRYLEELKPGTELNWPILESKSRQTDNWPYGKEFDVFNLLGKLRSLGIENVIFKTYPLEISPDTMVVEPNLGLNGIVLPSIKSMLKLLAEVGVKNPIKILEDITQIDDQLGEIFSESSNIYETNIDLKLSDLQRRYKNLNFKAYFKEYLGVELPLDTTVIVSRPSFFKILNDQLQRSLDASKLCNYLMIHYLLHFDASAKYSNLFCAAEVREMLNLAVNFLYYRHRYNYLQRSIEPDVREVFETVVDILYKQLQSHDLDFTVEQIESLRLQLASLTLNVGNLPENSTCETIAEFYVSLPDLDANNYYKNHLLKLRFVTRERLRAYSTAIIYERTSPPAIIYDRQRAKIAINYAYLIAPVYDYTHNVLSKYSLLGFILAHKLVQHWNFGNLNSARNRLVSQPLQTLFDCLGTAGRRFEDNAASEVIRKIVTIKFFNLQPLESVSSWKKQFFLNVAQHYCDPTNYQDLYNEAKSTRLNRIVMNIEGFAKAFNCPKGSKMNPSEKCQI